MNISREEIVEGLQAGRTLVIDRKDSPALPIVSRLEEEGLVTVSFHQLDEQSSCVKVRWKQQ